MKKWIVYKNQNLTEGQLCSVVRQSIMGYQYEMAEVKQGKFVNNGWPSGIPFVLAYIPLEEFKGETK